MRLNARSRKSLSTVRLPAEISGASLLGNNGSVAYFAAQNRVLAVNLGNGRLIWETAPKYATTDSGFRTAVTPNVIYVEAVSERGHRLVGLSARDGREKVSLSDAAVSSYVGGTLYSEQGPDDAFTADDPNTAKPVWSGGGGALAIEGPAYVSGGVVMQPFDDSSGKSVDVTYAYDVRSGRKLWIVDAQPEPLGYGHGTVYLNTTWFDPDYYVPITVSTIDFVSGKVLHSYGYAPDPQLYAGGFPNNPSYDVPARVSGAYLYIHIGHAWYRYLADRSPTAPYRLDHVDIRAWSAENRLLLTSNDAVFLGTMFPNVLQLRRFGNELDSPVVTRRDGDQYAVVDDRLVAFDRVGTPRAIGQATCSPVTSIVLWASRVALLCRDRMGISATLFPDQAEIPARPAMHPEPQHAGLKRFRLVLHAYAITPPPGLAAEWTAGLLAPLPGGAVAFGLQSGLLGERSAIGFVSPNGAMHFSILGAGVFPRTPIDVVAGSDGTVYFNNGDAPSIGALSPTGVLSDLIAASPTPTASGTPYSAIPTDAMQHAMPIAIASDGTLWFASNDPRPHVERVDGAKQYQVPSEYGKVRDPFVGASDGALWFGTANAIARVGRDGDFTRVTLPEGIVGFHGDPVRLMAEGSVGAMWVAGGRYIAEFGAKGDLIHHYVLPDIESQAYAMTQGCDEALYVNELGNGVARIDRDGEIEEYESSVQPLGDIATGKDCRLWFTAGWNGPTQYVGTFEFVPASR